MNFLEEIINYVDNFYWMSNIPSKLHPIHMTRFLTTNQYGDGNKIGFTKNIYQTSLRITYDESPYTDGEKFYYPIKQFYNEFFERHGFNTKDNVKLAIAMFNGIAVHEAAHCRIIDNWAKNNNTRGFQTKAEGFNRNYQNIAFNNLSIKVDENNHDDMQKIALMNLCSNMIEDIFIEKHFIPSFYAFANRFLKYATGMFFDKNAFELDHKEGKQITIYDVYYLRSNDVIFTQELIDNHELISKSNEVFNKINRNSTVNERAIIASELYEIFSEDVEKNPDNYKDAFDDMMNALLQEIKQIIQKIANGEITKDDLMDMMRGMGSATGEEGEGEVRKYGEYKKSDKENLEKELENQEKWVYDEFDKQQELSIWNKGVVIKDIHDKHFERNERSSGIKKDDKITFLSKLKSLANIFKYAKHGKIRTLRHLEEGILDEQNLHNFNNGNIFRGINQVRHAKNKPQVVIMTDLSGSTNSYNGEKIPLFYNMLNCAYSMQKLLTQSFVPNAGYSHTTYYNEKEGGYSSEIAGIASFEMPYLGNAKHTTNKFEERYNLMLRRAGLHGNADGFALRWASEQFDFTKKQTKILIMFNDGLPAECTWGNNYNATSELKESIELVRKKGIVVLAFAATESVVKQLEPLYGEEFVIHAYGANADKEAAKILDTLITAY